MTQKHRIAFLIVALGAAASFFIFQDLISLPKRSAVNLEKRIHLEQKINEAVKKSGEEKQEAERLALLAELPEISRVQNIISIDGQVQPQWSDESPSSESKSVSPNNNFEYSIKCKPETDACGGIIKDLKSGKEIPLPVFENLAWYEESYLFGIAGDFGGDKGLYLVPLKDFDELVQLRSMLAKYGGWIGDVFMVFDDHSDYDGPTHYFWDIDLSSLGAHFKVADKDTGRTRRFFFNLSTHRIEF